ncbi:MAG TPA: hypothetical protein VKN74_02775 [Candidatus Mcinerneyibacterium sp.]|nr:hypothetical protein [Candidatus Mcinerneyibacterium sp.]
MKKLVYSSKKHNSKDYSKHYLKKEYLIFPALNMMDRISVFLYCLYLGYKFNYNIKEKKAIIITHNSEKGFIQKNEKDIFIVYENSNNFRETIDIKYIYKNLEKRYGRNKLDKIIGNYMLKLAFS